MDDPAQMPQRKIGAGGNMHSEPLSAKPVTFSAFRSEANALAASSAPPAVLKVESKDDVLKVTSYVTASTTTPSIPLALVGLPTSVGVDIATPLNASIEMTTKARNAHAILGTEGFMVIPLALESEGVRFAH